MVCSLKNNELFVCSKLEAEGLVDPGPGGGGDVDYARWRKVRVLHRLQQGEVGRRRSGQRPQPHDQQQQRALSQHPERAAPHP